MTDVPAKISVAGRIWAVIARSAAWTWGVLSFVYLHFTRPITFREVVLFVGTALLGIGLASVYPPAAFIVPGAILAYVAIAGTA